MEIYRYIIGTDKKYSVSNTGKIFSNIYNKIMKPSDNGTGYKYIPLRISGKYKGFLIHRAVATAFIENPYKKTQVNHKDSNKYNNNFTNLEWVTPIENMNHAVENNLMEKGEDRYNAKLKNKDVIEIRKLYKDGYIQIRIAEKYNVSSSLICKIIKNKARV